MKIYLFGLFMFICGAAVADSYDQYVFNGRVRFGAAIAVSVRTAVSTTDNVTTADYFVCTDNSGGSAIENLPASPNTGLTFLIKDCSCAAATHNITITPAAGNIDNAGTFVMSTNCQSAAVTYTGAQWSVN